MVLPRVLEALDDIRSRHAGESVLLVCHAGIIYALEAYLKAQAGTRNPRRRYRIGNLGARWVIWDGARFRLGRRVNLLGDGEAEGASGDTDEEAAHGEVLEDGGEDVEAYEELSELGAENGDNWSSEDSEGEMSGSAPE
jgi:hypothetical protein